MSEDRNFRYCYYEKVGFGGIEEKKSLEILLREKPPDLLARLSQFTSRYSLPVTYRKLVWMLLLDIASLSNRITESRQTLWREITRDVIDSLEILSLVDSSLCKVEWADNQLSGHPKLLVLIFLLETKKLDVNVPKQFEQIDVIDLLNVSQVFTKEFLLKNTPYSLEDTYWIFKNFVSLVQANFISLIEMYEKFCLVIANEDQKLHHHLTKIGIIKSPIASNVGTNGSQNTTMQHYSNHCTSSPIAVCNYLQTERQKYVQKNKVSNYRPIATWFVRFFAGIIHHTFLIRVFDKLIGCLIHGSRPFYILISVGKALIGHQRGQLLLLNSPDDISKRLLSPLSAEESEQVVMKALSINT